MIKMTVIALTLIGSFAQAVGLSYEGQLFKPDGVTPLSGTNTQFKIQIRTPDNKNCLMYEEVRPGIDLSATSGNFAFTINDGFGSRTDTNGYSFDALFANHGTYAVDPSQCVAASASYTPGLSDARMLAVYFKDETMSAWEPIPSEKINYAPFALESKMVSGFNINSLVRIEDSGVTGNVSPLSNAQYTALLAVANGTSTAYTPAGQLNGSAVPTMNSGEVLGWNGTAWVSTSPVPAASSVTGTMIQNGAISTSQVASNVTINTSGTLGAAVTTSRDFKLYAASPSTFAIDMQAPALTASYSLVWPLTAGLSGQVLSTDGSGGLSWANAGGLSAWAGHGANISYDGGGLVGVGTSSPRAGLDISNGNLGLLVGADTNTLTRTDLTNKSARIAYPNYTVGSPDVAFLYGISGSGIGNIVSVGGGSSTMTAATQVKFYTANVLNTPSGTERMRIDPSGNVGIGTTSPGALLDIAGPIRIAGSGSETCDASHYVGGVRYNGGNIQFCNGSAWTTLGTAGSGITALTGDVSASGAGSVAATVNNVGGSTAALVHQAELLANGATQFNTSGAIVRRDGSGDVAANTITANGLTLNNAGSLLNLSTPIGASYNFKFPGTAGTGGQALTTDGSGNMSWASYASTTGANSFTGAQTFTAPIAVLDATPSSSTASGALTVMGGLGVQGTSYLSQTYLPSGTATSPGLAFGGPTGLYSPSSGQMAITAANTPVAIFSSLQAGFYKPITYTQAVTSPYSATGPSATPSGSGLNLFNPATGSDNNPILMTFKAANAASSSQYAYVGTVSSASGYSPDFVFGHSTALTSYAETMRIASNGNVGIGSTSPTSTLTFGSTTASIGADRAPSGSGATMTITASGAKAGVANVSGGSLILSSGTSTGVGLSSIQFMTSGGGSTGTNDSAPALAMILTGVGNLGVGTTNPAYKLDVAGDINASTGIRVAGVSICTSGGCTSSSDRRLKKNIEPLESSLEKVLQLDGVQYDYKDPSKYPAKHQVGLIAQDVEKIFPEVVVTDAASGLKAIAYDHLVAPLIESVKALYERSLSQEKRIDQLERENASIKAYLCAKDPSAPLCH